MYSFSPSSIPYGLAIFLFGRWAVVAQPFLFPLMLKGALLNYTLKAVFLHNEAKVGSEHTALQQAKSSLDLFLSS